MEAGWDLVVFDEAHKLAAHYFGTKLEKTARFRLAERLGERSRHLHVNDRDATQWQGRRLPIIPVAAGLDRFYGKFRGDAAHKVDVSDLCAAHGEEELVKFDNTPLFPERKPTPSITPFQKRKLRFMKR